MVPVPSSSAVAASAAGSWTSVATASVATASSTATSPLVTSSGLASSALCAVDAPAALSAVASSTVSAVTSPAADAAPVRELSEVCAARDAVLIADEAHALGVAGTEGRGLLRDADLGDVPHVVGTLTLSKSLGAQGGAVLASSAVREHLVNRARPFIYDTGLAPAAAGGALAALRVV